MKFLLLLSISGALVLTGNAMKLNVKDYSVAKQRLADDDLDEVDDPTPPSIEDLEMEIFKDKELKLSANETKLFDDWIATLKSGGEVSIRGFMGSLWHVCTKAGLNFKEKIALRQKVWHALWKPVLREAKVNKTMAYNVLTTGEPGE